MKTSSLYLYSALIFATSATVSAHDVDPYHDGRVAHVTDHGLEICYRSTAPAVGQTLRILRTSFITPNKGPVREQYTPGGSARVTEVASNSCVTAELIDGSAKRSDHAREFAPVGDD
jgi:hypothetical protein